MNLDNHTVEMEWSDTIVPKTVRASKMSVYGCLCQLVGAGWQTRVSVNNSIGSDNGLSPGRRQGIIWTNAAILFFRPLGVIFNKILIEIHIIAFKKIHFEMSSGKWRPFCLGLNLLTIHVWQCNRCSVTNALVVACCWITSKYVVRQCQWIWQLGNILMGWGHQQPQYWL